jgi:hypothetical protein
MLAYGERSIDCSASPAEDLLGASVYLGGPDVEGVRDLEDVA